MCADHVFPRHMRVDYPVIASGDGPWLFDVDGKKYLDGCGGAAVSCLGHSPKRVIDAVKDQLDKISYAHTSFFTSEPAERLADKLIELAPDNMERVYFVSGGSEATESAIKLARQYFLEIGQPDRKHIIARKQSYHGNTLGALSAGGNMWRKAQFEPLLVPSMVHIDPCHYWRFGLDGESEVDYGLRMANQLEEMILQLGTKNVAAFIAEPIVGATMGAVPPAEGYYDRIQAICQRHGVLLIMDEVMVGCGRTGKYFASEHYNIKPDMICIAKGIAAGVQPLAAMICSGEIYASIKKGSGFFQHGHTYLGHPAACAAGLAVLEEIETKQLLPRVVELGELLEAALHKKFGQHPFVGDIRGKGLFWGLELVEDRQTKIPFDPKLGIAMQAKKAAFERGLMIYPMGGTVDGKSGDHILLAPPFIYENEHIDLLVDLLAIALDDVFGDRLGSK
ncbi:aspartate aminotransferase family protein [Maritalea sp.]|uniref:aspartate aminotransferase family protein n=1 Tax=Maritalea sp. TaxID=2003361 RepID=UPI003EF8B25E